MPPGGCGPNDFWRGFGTAAKCRRPQALSGTSILILRDASCCAGLPRGRADLPSISGPGGNVGKSERGITMCYAVSFVLRSEHEQAKEQGDGPSVIPFLKRFTAFNVATTCRSVRLSATNATNCIMARYKKLKFPRFIDIMLAVDPLRNKQIAGYPEGLMVGGSAMPRQWRKTRCVSSKYPASSRLLAFGGSVTASREYPIKPTSRRKAGLTQPPSGMNLPMKSGRWEKFSKNLSPRYSRCFVQYCVGHNFNPRKAGCWRGMVDKQEINGDALRPNGAAVSAPELRARFSAEVPPLGRC